MEREITTNNIRFVVRNGEKILQQRFEIWNELDKVLREFWRDVPEVVEE